nr:glycosyltransferase [Methylobacterium sp. ZNC0032]
MRIAIQTFGTRGDVQPYLALARGLIARGHDVQLAAPEQFYDLASRLNVPFAPLPGTLLDLLDSDAGKAAVAAGRGFSAGLALLGRIKPAMTRLMDAEWEAVRGFRPDLILHHPKSLASPAIAARLRAKTMLASPLPGFTPTSAFASPILPIRLPGFLNKPSHAVMRLAPGMLFGRLLARWRRERLGRNGGPPDTSIGVLYAYSRHVLPVPPDWDRERVHVCGYWFLDEPGSALSPGLAGFLAGGAPPVYVGFGSMPGDQPREMTTAIVAGLRQAGLRGILASGGGALEFAGPGDDMLAIDAAPHDRLFPHVAATLHHGGAGTTGASLRAGVPTAIRPFFGDQPFWAERIRALGVGPGALPRQLTPDIVAAAAHALQAPDRRRRAAALGEAIRAERGIEAAILDIEERMRA